MKIVSIISSCRKSGNTAWAAELIENELNAIAQQNGTELQLDRFFIGYCDIKMCVGCRTCFDKGEEFCPHKDDVAKIWEKLKEADGILVGSPIYVEDVNGIMKNWIDRLAFNSHRPGLVGKSAYIISTSGIGSSKHAVRTMKTALSTWGAYIAGTMRFRTGAKMDKKDMSDKYGPGLHNAANELFYSIYNKYSLKPSLYSLVSFKVQQTYWIKKGDKESLDYKFWKDKGWLREKADYYIPNHQSFILKRLLAKLVGRTVAIFFI